MSSFGDVAAVSFDGDGTLWDFETSMRAALQLSAAALAEAGIELEGRPVEAAWLAEVREEVAASPRLRDAGMETIRLAAFEEAIGRCDPRRIDVAEQICARYMDDRLRALDPFPDVAGVISALRESHPLALVTNGNTHPAQLGFETEFGVVTIAGECALRKPDPAIYALTVERLGVDPGACLHVGDHPHEDVEAARRAGLRSVWVNRTGASWPAGLAPPEAELADLSSLPELLSRS
jgi:2-haloalkanoic acid dehalogenase type II